MFIERQEEILDLLKQKNTLSIKEISDELQVSEMTIRRDVAKIEETGVIRRCFGGVTLNKGVLMDQALPVRASNMPEEKKAIAREANKFVEDGDTICLDNGTTICQLAKLVASKKIIVATTSLSAGMNATKGEAKVYLTGGEINIQFMHTFGSGAEEFYRSMNFDIAFIGAAGITLKGGVLEFTKENAVLKKTMSQQSQKTILLADHTKFGKTAPFHSLELKQLFAVITDQIPSKEYMDYFKKLGIKLIVAD